MGYDVNRFESKVSDEFMCTICHDVLQDPLVTPTCEHVFCGKCITDWLQNGPTNSLGPSCPNDRTPATIDCLRPPLRSFRNLLNGLNIRCTFIGCSLYVKLNNLSEHESICMHNPINMEKEFNCPQNCGAMIKVQNRDKHNCVAYMRKESKLAEQKIVQLIEHGKRLENEMNQMKKSMNDEKQRYELIMLNLKNEVETKDNIIMHQKRQLDEWRDKITLMEQNLKLLEKNFKSNHNINGNNINKTMIGKKPAPMKPKPKPLQLDQSGINNNTTVDLLVDVNESDSSSSSGSIRSPNTVTIPPSPSSSSTATATAAATQSHSTFYSTNSTNSNQTNLNSNSVRHKESRVVRSAINLFHKLPNVSLPRMVPQLSTLNGSNSNLTINNSNQQRHSSLESSSSSTIPWPSNSGGLELIDLIRTQCKSSRIVQVLSLVNRRHFYPTNEYYKPIGTKRGGHSFTLAYEMRLMEQLESYITSDSRILNIGCGYGFITVCLAQLAKHVIGIDHVKELVAKANDIVHRHYGRLKEQNRVTFEVADGRYGYQQFAPYDMILIEPVVKQNIPDIIMNQLKPNGCICVVLKSETRLQMIKINRNGHSGTIVETLINDHQFLQQNHKDTLTDLRNQDSPLINRIRNF